MAFTHDGHVTFGAPDAGRTRTAFTAMPCQICGQPLDERAFVIVRPTDEANGYSPEPALHPECLPYTAAHCPMLNGTATRYRRRPVMATHPAGRPCSDPACPYPAYSGESQSPARSGQLAERYEAWMLRTSDYQLVLSGDRSTAGAQADNPSNTPVGISLGVAILRKRLLRKAALPPEAQRALDLLRALGL
ncbi:cell envelope biogenesis protein OmpA [Streptomyces canus]|uniref:Cell envelope biogenesis protein OmpA n=1 Tax=Streptomyces canus TaxID=58343 RepID=A0A101RKT2_9ACTN|nr:cell envelope biogenesis protein OmpA [Streptomyces canus]